MTMKTIVFLILMLFLVSGAIDAQISINPKAGLNYLWVGSQPKALSKEGAEPGFQFGGDLRIGKRFYFQPGFYIVRSGVKTQSLSDITQLDEGKATHFKIPVNVGYKLLNTPILKFRIYGGGVATRFQKVSAKSDLSASLYQPWYYGANVGAGLDFLLFSIDAGYEMGLTNYFVGVDNSRPNMFMISIGIKLF